MYVCMYVYIYIYIYIYIYFFPDLTSPLRERNSPGRVTSRAGRGKYTDVLFILRILWLCVLSSLYFSFPDVCFVVFFFSPKS